MKNLAVLSCCLMVILCGCRGGYVESALDDVETFIMERPDSALCILDTMDRGMLSTDRLRAHHALLHAMALDKNFIDVSDDSIASVALGYYAKHGPVRNEVRALYYLGLAYYYQEEYTRAIVEFTKAEELSEGIDSLYMGMAKVAQADTYEKTYNHIEELNCLREAYGIFEDTDNVSFLNIVKIRLLFSLFNQQRHEQADSILKGLQADDSLEGNIKATIDITSAYVNVILKREEEYPSVAETYRSVYEGDFGDLLTIKDFWAWAYALNALGHKDAAEAIIDVCRSDSSGTASYWMYMIEKQNNDMDAALDHLEEYVRHNDVEVSKALRQSLALSQKSYFQSQRELAESELTNARQTLVIALVLFCILAIVITFCIISYMKRQAREKEKYLSYISEIRHQLEEAEKNDYPALKKKYISLYRSRFETIGALCEQYSNSRGRLNAESSIYRKVVSMVDAFMNDYRNREAFEAMLDADMDNIMSNLRAELPKLKDADYEMFSLMVIGFDITIISHLMNVTLNTLYIRRSRLRQRVEESAAAHKKQFMQVLR